MDFLLHNSLQLIEHYMLVYGYWAVFFGVMLENAGVPVPGETILLVAGYFAATGEFHIALVMLIAATGDRKSTRLNSSHGSISYAVFCLKKKKKQKNIYRHIKMTREPK